MVMAEALSAGTPVIAFANGAAPEIVEDGISGYLVTDEADMATKIGLLDKIDPAACRERATRFDIHHIAQEYETAYYTTIDNPGK
jgi:glycosyltransferase involved in cell wall biosynthesis